MVGSPSTLYADPTWQHWLDWVRQHQAIASAEAVYSFAVDLPEQSNEMEVVQPTRKTRQGDKATRLRLGNFGATKLQGPENQQ